MKVLILKPSSLGDVVQALPVLRLIKRWRPDSLVYWWLDEDLRPLLEEDRDLDGVIPFARRRWANPRFWPEAWRSLQSIRQHRFDWILDLQGLARSGILSWLANGGLTVGVDDPREGAALFHDYSVPRPSPQTHAVDWYLAVVSRMGIPIHWDFDWMPVQEKPWRALRDRWPILDDFEWVALQPGARWENKRWPIESFVELAGLLMENAPRRRVMVLGGKDDQPLGASLGEAHGERILDLTGRITLCEMVEMIRHCRFMISNDTGPMHVASALGTPVIALFGPTDPRRTGPYRQAHHVVRHDLPCAPCLKSFCRHQPNLECLHRIKPRDILARIPCAVGE